MPEEPFALTLLAPLDAAEDYDAIQAAVLESERGRWFLQEYTRRNRSSDTALVLAAVARIEAVLRIGAFAPAHENGPDLQLFELRDAIALTKENLAAIRPDGRISIKAADFDRLTSAIAAVTARLRAAAEHVQETAWTLRDRGGHDRECETLEAQMREMSRACALLDDVGNGAAMITALLREVEERVESMIAEATRRSAAPAPDQPANPVPGPTPPATGAESATAAPATTPIPETPPPPAGSGRVEPASAVTAAMAAPAAGGLAASFAAAAVTVSSEQTPAGEALPAFDPEFERMMVQAVENALAPEAGHGEAETPPSASEAATATQTGEAPAASDDARLVLDNPAAHEPDLSKEVYAVLSGAALPAAERTPPVPAETPAATGGKPAGAIPGWFDRLEPIVRARSTPDVPAPARIEFTLGGESVVIDPGAAGAEPASARETAATSPSRFEPEPATAAVPAPAAQPATSEPQPAAEAAMLPRERGDASADIFADEVPVPVEELAPIPVQLADALPAAVADLETNDAPAPSSIAATLKREIAAVMADISEAIRAEIGKAAGANAERGNGKASTNGAAAHHADAAQPAAGHPGAGMDADMDADMGTGMGTGMDTGMDTEDPAAAEPHLTLFDGDEARPDPTATMAAAPAPAADPATDAASDRASEGLEAREPATGDSPPRLRETAPRDPLASIAALSEEEKIALFS